MKITETKGQHVTENATYDVSIEAFDSESHCREEYCLTIHKDGKPLHIAFVRRFSTATKIALLLIEDEEDIRTSKKEQDSI